MALALLAEAVLAVQGLHVLGSFGEDALEVDVGGVHSAGSHGRMGIAVVGMDVGLEDDEVAVVAAHDLDGSQNLAVEPCPGIEALEDDVGGVEYGPAVELAGFDLLEYARA